MSEREARETLRCVPCIFVRILDNPVCFSGCLNTTHVPAEQTFPWSCRGRRVRRWVSVATTREGSLEGALRFHPPRGRCHQAQLGTTLGHQRVYHGFSFTCRMVVCVQPSSRRTPVTGAVSPVLFLSLIPFHSPMRRTPPRLTSLLLLH